MHCSEFRATWQIFLARWIVCDIYHWKSHNKTERYQLSWNIFFFVAKKQQQQTTGNVKRNHPIESAIAHVLRNPIYIYGSCKDDIVGCKETEL